MTWVSWRQFRTDALVGALELVIVAIILGITGVHLAHLYSTYHSQLAGCSGQTCQALRAGFLNNYSHVKLFGTMLIALPAIIGIFLGAPLIARELETGSFRLAWTQGVTRNRWLASKLLVVGLGTALIAGLTSLAVTWWAEPIDKVTATRLSPAIFDQRGVVPIGYALFGFALGALLGVVFRRTLPAMAATLVGFVAVRIVTQDFLRPDLITPIRTSFPLSRAGGVGISGGPGGPDIITGTPQVHGAWVTSSKLVDAAGHSPTHGFIAQACSNLPGLASPGAPGRAPAPGPAQAAFQHCINAVGQRYHVVATYQPLSRFWAFQWLELAVFLGFTAVLVAATFVLVRRRVG
jgi:hypothetical protein